MFVGLKDRAVIEYKTRYPQADDKEIAGAYPSVGKERIMELIKENFGTELPV